MEEAQGTAILTSSPIGVKVEPPRTHGEKLEETSQGKSGSFAVYIVEPAPPPCQGSVESVLVESGGARQISVTPQAT